jgi:hypothetical protein
MYISLQKTFTASVLLALTVLIVLSLAVPSVHAQTAAGSADLSATIRAAILKDPRARSLSPDQINTIVNALTSQAKSSGLSAQSIAWRPGELPTSGESLLICTNEPQSLCAFERMFGISNPDAATPVIGLVLLTLVVIVGIVLALFHPRRGPHIVGQV